MDLDEIRRIKEETEDELLRLTGITGVDIGYKTADGRKTDEMAIIVYVENKRDVALKKQIPPSIQGVPTVVIERRFVLHPSSKDVTD